MTELHVTFWKSLSYTNKQAENLKWVAEQLEKAGKISKVVGIMEESVDNLDKYNIVKSGSIVTLILKENKLPCIKVSEVDIKE